MLASETTVRLSHGSKAYDDRSFFLVSLNVDPRFDHLLALSQHFALSCSALGCGKTGRIGQDSMVDRDDLRREVQRGGK